MLEDHPAREQVRTPAAELARARSGEHETNAPAAAIGERLNGVEERGYALHLVDDDERAGRQRLDFASQPRRVLGVPEKLGLVGEVDVDLGAEVAADRRLADLARTEQEDVALGGRETAGHHPVPHRGLFTT